MCIETNLPMLFLSNCFWHLIISFPLPTFCAIQYTISVWLHKLFVNTLFCEVPNLYSTLSLVIHWEATIVATYHIRRNIDSDFDLAIWWSHKDRQINLHHYWSVYTTSMGFSTYSTQNLQFIIKILSIVSFEQNA